MHELTVAHAIHPCRVVVTTGFDGLAGALDAALPQASARAILVTDAHVAPHHARAVAEALGRDVATLVVPAGEAHKTVESWTTLVSQLLERGVDRSTPVVALGGGVVTDLAGFAAATVLRGVPLVNVPTSLLGMVDASIGGKTGVNHPRGKNLVGAFHPARLVWMATDSLRTLPDVERRAGLGEVVKTAAVGDPDLLHAASRASIQELVLRCVAVKGRIVEADEHESGARMLLNAGHTIGHAIETALGHGSMPHGFAVGLGLVAEARFAVREGICEDEELPDRLEATLATLGLPTTRPAMKFDVFEAALRTDKKRAGALLRVPLPERPGVYRVRGLDPAAVERLVHS